MVRYQQGWSIDDAKKRRRYTSANEAGGCAHDCPISIRICSRDRRFFKKYSHLGEQLLPGNWAVLLRRRRSHRRATSVTIATIHSALASVATTHSALPFTSNDLAQRLPHMICGLGSATQTISSATSTIP